LKPNFEKLTSQHFSKVPVTFLPFTFLSFAFAFVALAFVALALVAFLGFLLLGPWRWVVLI